MEKIKIINQPPRSEWANVFKRPGDFQDIRQAVQSILLDVKQNGDEALVRLTKRFDDVHISNTSRMVPQEVKIDLSLRSAIDQAMSNIEKYHSAQQRDGFEIETMPGINCKQISRPIQKVGLYIPGGSAPLISTLMMLAIPARIAQCKEIIICTPPTTNGDIHPALQYIATKLDIDKIYTVGGAQAIAAMAYGTETIPRVQKIFGPGNSFVTVAKEMIQAEGIAIDMPAGPSELMVVADDSCVPDFVASDLLSQAEHGPDSQVVCIASTSRIAQQIQSAVENQLTDLPRKMIAEKALLHSCIIIESNETKQVELINNYAPEHLILATKKSEKIVENVINAGSIFLGNWSAESIGDYASGPNHTLPTNGHAKAYAGVNLDAFMKKISVQQVTEKGFENIAATVEVLAGAENLIGHQRAVSIRKDYLNETI